MSNVAYLNVNDPAARIGFGEENDPAHYPIEELEIRYGPETVTLFLCPERGVRDGSDGTNNGSDIADLTLTYTEAARLAALLTCRPVRS
jgi:hypothetical protein